MSTLAFLSCTASSAAGNSIYDFCVGVFSSVFAPTFVFINGEDLMARDACPLPFCLCDRSHHFQAWVVRFLPSRAPSDAGHGSFFGAPVVSWLVLPCVLGRFPKRSMDRACFVVKTLPYSVLLLQSVDVLAVRVSVCSFVQLARCSLLQQFIRINRVFLSFFFFPLLDKSWYSIYI